MPPDDDFNTAAFAASAAVLVANHVMADAAWSANFPKLPQKRPELRMVLLDLHRSALSGEPLNLGDARDQIEERFDVAPGSARAWLDDLEELGLVVRKQGRRKNEFLVVPSARAKQGLFLVGQAYLTYQRQVSVSLRRATRGALTETPGEIDWMAEVTGVLEMEVIDYDTTPGKF